MCAPGQRGLHAHRPARCAQARRARARRRPRAPARRARACARDPLAGFAKDVERRRGRAGETYLRTLAAAKAGAPRAHVHAFSPLEVWHGAASLRWPLARFLAALAAAGLGSLPGTAAEVLCDAVRAAICPDKLTSAQWLQARGRPARDCRRGRGVGQAGR